MILLSLAACLADIRPDAIKNSADAPQDGRALLEAAAEAHGGLDAWRAHQRVSVSYTDAWLGIYRIASPWPSAEVSVVHEQVLHSFDSELYFQGEHDGLLWSITDWQTAVQDVGVMVPRKGHKEARFILPTMSYFVAFPYRILEAPIIFDAGPVDLDGVRYQTVFVTWEDARPQPEWDQYILYINPDTGRIDKATYTVRELARFVTGTMHFEDYRLVDDAWLPHRMVVTAKPTDTDADAMHIVEVSSYRFD